MTGDKVIFLVAAACLAHSGASDKTLELVQIVFRHGDRTGITDIPVLPPANWEEGMGQLTDIGMKQHYNVGTYFRSHYVTNMNFLPAKYNRSRMVVRSTDVDRTLMSAASQLAGWYPQSDSVFDNPDLKWRPIPIHTKPVKADYLLRAYDRGTCSRYDQLVDKHNKESDYKEKQDEVAPPLACKTVGLTEGCNNRDFCKAVGKLAGWEEQGTISGLWKIEDNLVCRRAHGRKLPDWAGFTEAGNQTFQHIRNLFDWDMFDMFTGKEERRLVGGTLVKEMIEQMEKKMNRSDTVAQDLKVLLYSAHDTTLAAFLEALETDHWRSSSPPYASAVIVELWTIDGSPTVKLMFKNGTALAETKWESGSEPFVLKLAGCDSALCSLSSFKEAVKDVIPGDWEEECRTSNGLNKAYPVLIGITGAILGVLGLAALIVWVRRRQRAQRTTSYHYTKGDEDEDRVTLHTIDDEDDKEV